MERGTELEILERIAADLGRYSDQLPEQQVTGFMAMVGHLFTGELMVVGRAVNGWTTPWFPRELQDEESITQFVNDVLGSVTDNARCPMRWVTDCWGNYDQDYNTRTSAFWRAIRQTVEVLGISNTENAEWPSCLVWSNLYKVAPAAGGNPSATLSNLQSDQCKEMLREELRMFRPKRALFLTGLDWAQPFAEFSDIITKPSEKREHVQATGTLSINGKSTSVVIATHPQGKNEKSWVKEVCEEFGNR